MQMNSSEVLSEGTVKADTLSDKDRSAMLVVRIYQHARGLACEVVTPADVDLILVLNAIKAAIETLDQEAARLCKLALEKGTAPDGPSA